MPTQCWDCARLGGCTRPDHGATGCAAFVNSELTKAEIAWILGCTTGAVEYMMRLDKWIVVDKLAERGVRAVPDKKQYNTHFFRKCP